MDEHRIKFIEEQIKIDDIDIIKKLLDDGLNIYEELSFYVSVLKQLMRNNCVKIVEYLLSSNEYLFESDKSSIVNACSLEMINLLKSRNVDITYQDPVEGNIISSFTHDKDLEIVKYLISLGINPHYPDFLDYNIDYCIRKKQYKLSCYLINYTENPLKYLCEISDKILFEDFKELVKNGFTLSTEKITSYKLKFTYDILIYLNENDDNFHDFVKNNKEKLLEDNDEKCRELLQCY